LEKFYRQYDEIRMQYSGEISPFSIDQSDSFFITTPIVSTEIYSEEILRNAVWSAGNQEVLLSHVSPNDNVNSYMGRVAQVWWDDSEKVIMGKLEINEGGSTAIYDDAGEGKEHPAREIREQIRLDMDKPIKEKFWKGVSIGAIVFLTKKGDTEKIEKIEIREVSLARNPACKVCKIRAITAYELSEVDIVSNESETEQVSEVRVSQHEVVTAELETRVVELERQLAEKETTIADSTNKNSVLHEDNKGMLAQIQKNSETLQNYKVRFKRIDEREKIIKINQIFDNFEIPKGDASVDGIRRDCLTYEKETLNTFLQLSEVFKATKASGLDRTPVSEMPNFGGNALTVEHEIAGEPEDPVEYSNVWRQRYGDGGAN